jgi:hypothetical protein
MGLSSLIIILISQLLFDFEGMSGQDTYAYASFSNNLSSFFAGEEALEPFYWPQFYPFLGSIFSLGFFRVEWVLQYISMFAFLGSGYRLMQVVALKFTPNKTVQIIVFFLFVLTPYTLRQGLLTMSDSLNLFLLLSSLYFLLKYENTGTFKSIILSFVLLGLAFNTRFVSLIFALPIGLYFLKILISNKKWIHILAGGGLLFLIGIHYLITFYAPEVKVLRFPWYGDLSISNLFLSEFETPNGIQSYSFMNIIYILKPFFHFRFNILLFPLLLFSIIKLKTIKSKKAYLFIAFSWLIYNFFLALFPIQMDRFLIVSYAFSTLLCVPAIMWLVQSYSRYRIIGLTILLTAAFGMLSVSVYSMKAIYLRNQLELEIANYLKKEEVKSLYSFDIDVALNYRLDDVRNINLWKDRIEDFNEAEYVLFNENKFEIQWESENPMLNWNKLNHDKKLKIEKKFRDGWTLYSF